MKRRCCRENVPSTFSRATTWVVNGAFVPTVPSKDVPFGVTLRVQRARVDRTRGQVLPRSAYRARVREPAGQFILNVRRLTPGLTPIFRNEIRPPTPLTPT